jgi:hypothetical protein
VHIEIESPDSKTSVKSRLPGYYIHLRAKHGLPVLPIVVYLKVGLEGIGVDVCDENFYDLQPLRLQYLYVGLPFLDAIQYVQGDNWIGVALSALMRIPRNRVLWLGTEALRRISEAPLSDQQRFLLGECVEAYLPVEPDQLSELTRFLSEASNSKVRAMNKTTYDRGIEKGVEKSMQMMQNTLLELGTSRFGSAPPAVETRFARFKTSGV